MIKLIYQDTYSGVTKDITVEIDTNGVVCWHEHLHTFLEFLVSTGFIIDQMKFDEMVQAVVDIHDESWKDGGDSFVPNKIQLQRDLTVDQRRGPWIELETYNELPEMLNNEDFIEIKDSVGDTQCGYTDEFGSLTDSGTDTTHYRILVPAKEVRECDKHY